jgi:hypothetical protein
LLPAFLVLRQLGVSLVRDARELPEAGAPCELAGSTHAAAVLPPELAIGSAAVVHEISSQLQRGAVRASPFFASGVRHFEAELCEVFPRAARGEIRSVLVGLVLVA